MKGFFIIVFLLWHAPVFGAPDASGVRVRHSILVNKWDNTLRYYVTGQPMRVFRVATGLYKCTPEGRFRIIQKSFVSRQGRGQFGTRWLGLNTLGRRGWYRIGIHGTNQPQTIGKYASKACVRMLNSDINWLYDRVPYNTTVRIVNVPVAKPKRPVPLPSSSPMAVWLREVSRHHAMENQLMPMFGFKRPAQLHQGLPYSIFKDQAPEILHPIVAKSQQNQGGRHEAFQR